MGGRTALPKTSTPCHPTVQMPNEKWSSREGTYSVLTGRSFPVVSLTYPYFHLARLHRSHRFHPSHPPVAARRAASRSRTSGTGSAVYSALVPASGQDGGSAVPLAAQAACRAAPSATYSAGSGTVTGTPKIDGAIARTADDRAAPPMRITRCAVIPQSARLSMASAREQSTASTAARARFSGVVLVLVRPRRIPWASGRFGDRSPSR